MAKRKKSQRKHNEWLPWSLDDWHKEHPVDKALVAEAAQLAEIKTKVWLEAEIKSVAALYWRHRREFDRPPEKWRVGKVNQLKRATERLLTLIRQQEGTALSYLKQYVQIDMGRTLLRQGFSDRESIESILEELKVVCRRYVKPPLGSKRGSGAREKAHLKEAAEALVLLWRSITHKPFPLNLDTEVHRKEEFVSIGARFIHTALLAIDGSIELAETSSALRSLAPDSRGGRKRKPREIGPKSDQ